MPIYEFYCDGCHTIYKFFSRTANTQKIPLCPECEGVRLARHLSTFATLSGNSEDKAGEEGMPHMDEAKMEKAMSMLAKEAGSMNDDDPRQAAALMRKLADATGLKMGAGMEEAMRRLERGEDPDKIEEEMGDLLEGEEPFFTEARSDRGRSNPKPRVDEKLYDL